ncbi:DUF580-domain-containing protein [Backusella circina FSU 941]|nr:DUF580-domain-containing protein [Backusella circina FSU 941]
MYQPDSTVPQPPPQQQEYYPPPPPPPQYNPEQNGYKNQYSQNNVQQTYINTDPSHLEYGQPPPLNNQVQPETNQNEKIRPSSGFNDVWATILWLLNFAAFIGVSVVALHTYNDHTGSTNGVQSYNAYPGTTFDNDTIKIYGLSGLIGFGMSFLYLLLANAFPKQLIVTTFVGSIIVYFGVTIYYFVRHYYSAAIIFLIFSCLYLACFFFWRHKFAFATIMLKTVVDVTKKHPSTIVVGMIALILQTAFSFWFMFAVTGAYQRWYSSSSNNSMLNCVMVFLVFSFYWTSQVITYVAHVILAGVFATVYFTDEQTRHPVLGSTKRALTTSFGSICFGGLLIAFINVIRYFLQIAQANTDNGCLSFLICIIQCIVGCAQGLFEWFNYYAFSGVAIYGKPFVPTARNTWSMIKDRGVEAMINDSLIGNVLFMGGLLVGVLCGLFGYIYLEAARPVYNQDGGMTPIVVMVCFLIGASMFSSIATVISSGVATTFVCLAEDPQALQRSKPELFEKIRETWPRVVQGV